MKVEVIKLDKQLYQIEVGNRVVVMIAKDANEAIKLASKYLPIKESKWH